MKRTFPFLFYLLFFGALSFYVPFVVLYYQGLGFNGAEIGMLTGIAPLISMLAAPVWTGVADARQQHKLIMSLTVLSAALIASLFPWMKTLLPVLLLVIMFALFFAPIVSLADSATMNMLAEKKEMYGRVRLGGTIGFGAISPVAGLLVQSFGIRLAFWGYAVVMFLAFIISQKFSFGRNTPAISLREDMRRMLFNRRWVFFMCLAFVGGIAFATINNYLFPYMAEMGASKTTMGIALTISSIGELPVLFFAHHLLRRFKAYGLFILGIAITGLRLLLYAAFNFPAGILIFQLLNGMTFPMIWVAGVSYADESSPPEMKATAQGVFGAAMVGIGAAVGAMAGGLLVGSIGSRLMYLAMGIFTLVSLAVLTLMDRADRIRQARSLV